MAVRFYRCSHCGNIIIKVVDKKVPVVCCGEKMEELVPSSTDAAVEKHVPVISVDGNIVTVSVGSVAHPMIPEHFIQFIVLETSNGIQIAELAAGNEPVATFAVTEGTEVKAAYAYCNLHGLWVNE
jgi:superoxide reductase|uniref:Superoxide reductase n=1 Tax=uncultured bacterium Contig1532b TaxID=1393450 RepID=W0FL14_9BACT|nr:superoxide reductase [uncultured bacterium Contig1532b]